MKAWVAQFRKGLVELCVLAALDREETYGYELLRRLSAQPELAVTESTVYPILARLTREGCLEVRRVQSPSGPPRRYYRVTKAGRVRLREMRERWRPMRDFVDELLGEERK